MYNLTNFQFIL